MGDWKTPLLWCERRHQFSSPGRHNPICTSEISTIPSALEEQKSFFLYTLFIFYFYFCSLLEINFNASYSIYLYLR